MIYTQGQTETETTLVATVDVWRRVSIRRDIDRAIRREIERRLSGLPSDAVISIKLPSDDARRILTVET